jgi:hypothetical protein
MNPPTQAKTREERSNKKTNVERKLFDKLRNHPKFKKQIIETL